MWNDTNWKFAPSSIRSKSAKEKPISPFLARVYSKIAASPFHYGRADAAVPRRSSMGLISGFDMNSFQIKPVR